MHKTMNSVKGHIVDVIRREIFDVIPDIKITDRHLVDTRQMSIIY